MKMVSDAQINPTTFKGQSPHADLAEYYAADGYYRPGTVLEFGGDDEVTIASEDSRTVAGVVSTSPAYVMNSMCEGDHSTVIALQGRVPCLVRGKIDKGDLLVSAGEGYAKASDDPKIGSVIGKAIQSFDGAHGMIEIAVGRL